MDRVLQVEKRRVMGKVHGEESRVFYHIGPDVLGTDVSYMVPRRKVEWVPLVDRWVCLP